MVRWHCGSAVEILHWIQTGFRWGDRNYGRCFDSADRIRRLTDDFLREARSGSPRNPQRWDHRCCRWGGHCLTSIQNHYGNVNRSRFEIQNANRLLTLNPNRSATGNRFESPNRSPTTAETRSVRWWNLTRSRFVMLNRIRWRNLKR